MELQTYINSHPDYISEFRKNDIKINSYKKLKIISLPYGTEPDKNDLWKMFLKGAIISSDNKVICLPPIKAIDLGSDPKEPESTDTIYYEHLIDGTMINLFHYNNELIHVTTKLQES